MIENPETTTPRVIAIVPARGGSKGVPGKNLRRVGGVPLVARAITACRRSRFIDTVFVSTDDPEIAEISRAAGAQVIERPPTIAGDLASSESALLHALEELAAVGHTPEVLVFVQCTSPFIQPEDLDEGVSLVLDDACDSAFSGVATYDFIWRDGEAAGQPGGGSMVGQNHDAAVRPRRQDRRPDFRETGAFYVMRVSGFRAHQHRFFGRTRVVEVPELTAMEIDTPQELIMAESLASVVDPPTTDLAGVRALITDFDGVHTADTAYLDQDGHESVRVSRSDGYGVAELRRAGVPFLILSKERNPVVAARAAKLSVESLQGIDDKIGALSAWLADRGIDSRDVAYLGNDVNDLGPMSLVGWPAAVADAHPQVRAAARVILNRSGGNGAVREICDRILAGRQVDDLFSLDGAGSATAGGPDGSSARSAQAVPAGASASAGTNGNRPA
jgi:YrbI family 3-deoxy-D-manno-octulosonate 8-phosphate phosphatase